MSDQYQDIMRFFRYDHLPEHLQRESKPFCLIAQSVPAMDRGNTEILAGLRKLLEAKDCFVRAAL